MAATDTGTSTAKENNSDRVDTAKEVDELKTGSSDETSFSKPARPKPKTCCFCILVLPGSLAIAVFSILSSIFFLFSDIHFLKDHYNHSHNVTDVENGTSAQHNELITATHHHYRVITSFIDLVACVLTIIVCIALIVGILRRNQWLLLPAIGYGAVEICLRTACIIVLGVHANSMLGIDKINAMHTQILIFMGTMMGFQVLRSLIEVYFVYTILNARKVIIKDPPLPDNVYYGLFAL